MTADATGGTRIAARTAEIKEVIAARARMFAITSPEQLQTWDLLTIIVGQWSSIEQAATEEGPYIYRVTRTTMSKIDLQAALRRPGWKAR
jgi:hypothetical protein